jgi:hypothetical protein
VLVAIRIAAASQAWGTATAVRTALSGLALLALALLAGDHLPALPAELVPPLDDDLGLALTPAVVTPAALPARTWLSGHAATTRPASSGRGRARLVPPSVRARVRCRARRRRASRRGARRSGRRGSRSASAPAPPRSQACPPDCWRHGGHRVPRRPPRPRGVVAGRRGGVVGLLAGEPAHRVGALRAWMGWRPGAGSRSGVAVSRGRPGPSGRAAQLRHWAGVGAALAAQAARRSG